MYFSFASFVCLEINIIWNFIHHTLVWRMSSSDLRHFIKKKNLEIRKTLLSQRHNVKYLKIWEIQCPLISFGHHWRPALKCGDISQVVMTALSLFWLCFEQFWYFRTSRHCGANICGFQRRRKVVMRREVWGQPPD